MVQNPPCPCFGQGFICRYNHILGDNQEVTTQPNLNGGDSNNDIRKFLAWQDGTQRPYISFKFSSATTVTTINIEFLNYPAQNLSLPNLQLYATGGVNTDPNSPNAQLIDFDIVNNSGLSQDDHQVTNISLIFSSTYHSLFYFTSTGTTQMFTTLTSLWSVKLTFVVALHQLSPLHLPSNNHKWTTQ